MKNTDRKVKDIMSTHLIILMEKDPLIKASEIFQNHNIHHIPIVNEKQQLKGMLSMTDFAVTLDPMTPFNHPAINHENKRTMKQLIVEDIMAKDIKTVYPDTPLIIVIQLLKENAFHSIPVVNHNNELQGLITTYDIIEECYQNLEQNA